VNDFTLHHQVDKKREESAAYQAEPLVQHQWLKPLAQHLARYEVKEDESG